MSVRRLLPADPGSMALGGEALGGPESGAPGAWVGGDLRRARHDPLRRDESKPGLATADADRRLGGAGAASALALEEALDDLVLEGVVAEHHEPAARAEQVDGGGEPGRERVELFVDRDPEGLEDARRRMDPATARRTARRGALDDDRELLGGRDRGRAPRLDDRPGDPARERLLAISLQERGELRLVEGREQIGCWNAATGVEAHVERATGPDPEATLGVRQLEARQAQVEEAAVDRRETRLGGHRLELPEVRLAEDEPIAEATAEPCPNPGDGRLVGVDPEEAAIRVGGGQHAFRVPAATEGGVDLPAAGSRGQHLDDLVGEDGHVDDGRRDGHGQIPSPAIASANVLGSVIARR